MHIPTFEVSGIIHYQTFWFMPTVYDSSHNSHYIQSPYHYSTFISLLGYEMKSKPIYSAASLVRLSKIVAVLTFSHAKFYYSMTLYHTEVSKDRLSVKTNDRKVWAIEFIFRAKIHADWGGFQRCYFYSDLFLYSLLSVNQTVKINARSSVAECPSVPWSLFNSSAIHQILWNRQYPFWKERIYDSSLGSRKVSCWSQAT